MKLCPRPACTCVVSGSAHGRCSVGSFSASAELYGSARAHAPHSKRGGSFTSATCRVWLGSVGTAASGKRLLTASKQQGRLTAHCTHSTSTRRRYELERLQLPESTAVCLAGHSVACTAIRTDRRPQRAHHTNRRRCMTAWQQQPSPRRVTGEVCAHP